MNSTPSLNKASPILSKPPRIVSEELLSQLDPIERAIAESYLKSGRWVLAKKTGAEG